MNRLSEPLFSRRELKRLKSAARRSHVVLLLIAWTMRAAALGVGCWVAAVLLN